MEFIDNLTQTNELLFLQERLKTHQRAAPEVNALPVVQLPDTEGRVTSLLLVLKFNVTLILQVTRGAEHSRQDKMVCFFSSVMGCKM